MQLQHCMLVILLIYMCMISSESSIVCPVVKRFRRPEDINPRTGSHFPNTLLFSFEGSGNTWTRFLFENATGMFPAEDF